MTSWYTSSSRNSRCTRTGSLTSFRGRIRSPFPGSRLRNPGAPPAPPDLMSIPEKLASAVVDVVESPFTGVSRMVSGLQKAGFPNEVAGQVNEEPPVGPSQELALPPKERLQQAAEPIADVIGGAMEAGTIPMVAGVMLAPLVALPALGGGMIAAYGAGKAAEAAGAPPAVVEIVQNVAGLAAGGVVAHGITGRARAAAEGRRSMIEGTAASRATVDETLRSEAETGMRQDFAAETGQVEGEQAIDRTLRADLDRETGVLDQEQAATDKLYADLAFNAGLEQLAQAHRDAGAGGRSPFDYLDQVDTISAAADGTIRDQVFIDPRRMLPPPSRVSMEPPDVITPGAMSGVVPNAYSAEGRLVDYLGNRVPLAAAPPPDTLPGHLDAIAKALEEGGLSTPEAPALTTPGGLTRLDDIVSRLEESLTPPPPAPIPDTLEGIRAQQQAELQPYRIAARDEIVSRLENSPHQDGGMADTEQPLTGGQGAMQRKYVPPVGADPIYHQIVGGVKSKPTVRLITDIARVYRDTGATSSADIPKDVHLATRRRGSYGPREFLRAYDRWMPSLLDAETGMAGYIRGREAGQERVAARGRLVPREAGAPPEVGEAGASEVGAPPGMSDEIPDFLQNLEGEPGAEGGHDEEFAGEGVGEGVSEGGNLSDAAKRMQNQLGFDSSTYAGARRLRAALEEMPESARPDPPGWWTELYNRADDALIAFERGSGGKINADEPPVPGDTGQQISFWDALKHDVKKLATDTEASLRLTVGPDDEPGLRRWFGQQRAKYGQEDWFQAAEDALEEGDHRSAYRIAATAAARAQITALGQARKDERASGGSPAATAARQAVEDVVDRARESHRKQVEAELGMSLPKSVDVSPEGILLFEPGGKGVPALRARATDLTLARSLTNDIVDKIDPTQLMRMGTSDEVEPQFQVSKQIADQTAREFDDATIETLAEFMGFQDRPLAEQRLEVARQLSRTYSHAGRILGDLGRWTQQNEDLMYQIGSVNETGAATEVGSVGALQARGITDPDGFVRWLGGKASAEEINQLGFTLPAGVDLKNDRGQLTEQAQRYARNWFRRGQRLEEIQTTIDRIVGEQGTALDRALAALTIAPDTDTTKGGRAAAINGLSKAALIARPGTAIRNAISQTGRYGAGMADEAVAGLLSLATGNPAQATSHFRMMKYLAQGTARKGNNVLALFTHPTAEGLQATYDYTEAMIRTLPPEDMRKTLSLLSNLPKQESRFLGSLALDDTLPIEQRPVSQFRALGTLQRAIDYATQPKVRNVLTIFNRVQEFAFRGAVFDAVLRHQIEAKGLDPVAELTGDPRGLIAKVGAPEFDRMAGAAVSASLDYTFAAEPMPGTAPALLLDAFRKVPVLSFLLQMGQPFARFNFVSAPRWVWDHTPLEPVADMALLALSRMRGDSSPILRGRYSQMLQMRNQEKVMLDLTTQIARGKYDSAQALSDFMGSKESAAQSQKVLKGIQARAGQTLPLEALQPDLERVQGELTAAKNAQAAARIKWKQSDVRVRNLEQQEAKARQTVQSLQAVGAAKSPQEYFARVATGSAMLAAGYAFWKWKADHSTTPGSPDVQWYEFPTSALPETAQTAAGLAGQTIDLRSYAPEVQQLFLGDLLGDITHHTDWSQLKGSDLWGPHEWSAFMKANYLGKYTGEKAWKDALEAYVSMQPAAGSTRTMLDILTGSGETAGKGADLGSLQDAVLAMTGQYIARFTSPLGTINDVVGQFSPEDAKARIPEEGTEEHHNPLTILGEPTLSNIPFARRAIPEKVDALTGQPVAGVDPIARQFGGLTKRLQNRVRQELTATGTPYSAAVPRQTGDREFDNAVNREYSKVLQEFLPDVLENETYQAASPELRRDILAYGVPGESAVFPQLKKLAYRNVIDQLGEDYQNKMQSPEVAAKISRWQKFVDAADQELEPALHADQDREHLEGDRQEREDREPGAPPAPPQF
jgi:hypothetical protein